MANKKTPKPVSQQFILKSIRAGTAEINGCGDNIPLTVFSIHREDRPGEELGKVRFGLTTLSLQSALEGRGQELSDQASFPHRTGNLKQPAS